MALDRRRCGSVSIQSPFTPGKRLMKYIVSAIAGIMFAGAAYAEDPKLPNSMVWSAYDLGSSGYAEATGIANALRENYRTRIRIVPAGTIRILVR